MAKPMTREKKRIQYFKETIPFSLISKDCNNKTHYRAWHQHDYLNKQAKSKTEKQLNNAIPLLCVCVYLKINLEFNGLIYEHMHIPNRIINYLSMMNIIQCLYNFFFSFILVGFCRAIHIHIQSVYVTCFIMNHTLYALPLSLFSLRSLSLCETLDNMEFIREYKNYEHSNLQSLFT